MKSAINSDSYILCMDALHHSQELAKLAESGHKHVYGISQSSTVYKMPYYNKIKYMVADPSHTHFPEGMFDYVFAIPSATQMGEARRIARNNAVLVMSDGKRTIVNKPLKPKLPTEVNVVCPSLGKNDGISQYTYKLAERLRSVGIIPHLYGNEHDIKNRGLKTILQYEVGLKVKLPDQGKGYIIEAHATPSWRVIFLEIKTRLKGLLRDPADIFNILYLFIFHFDYVKSILGRLGNREEIRKLQMQTLLLRSNELARASGIKKYTIMPHIAYPKGSVRRAAGAIKSELHIGSFGFSMESKNFPKICRLAQKLTIRCTILLSITDVSFSNRKVQIAYAERLKRMYSSDKIHILIAENYGIFTDGQIRTLLNPCTHLISAQNDALGTSGSMRYMVSLGKPVISVDNYQAREAQVHRVKRLSDVTIRYLEQTTSVTELDDGFAYLLKVLESDGMNKASTAT